MPDTALTAALAPIRLQSLQDVFRLAKVLVRAGAFVPAHFRRVEELAAAILKGLELGLPPMTAINGMHVVDGKVGLNYDLIVGLLRRHGYRVEWLETTAELARVQLTHSDGSSMNFSYSKEDAITARLWGRTTRHGQPTPWVLHPATMLRARCISNAARAFAGDVLAGVYSLDEIDEIRRAHSAISAPSVATASVSVASSATTPISAASMREATPDPTVIHTEETEIGPATAKAAG